MCILHPNLRKKTKTLTNVPAYKRFRKLQDLNILPHDFPRLELSQTGAANPLKDVAKKAPGGDAEGA
jgi:hypothetical protein